MDGHLNDAVERSLERRVLDEIQHIGMDEKIWQRASLRLGHDRYRRVPRAGNGCGAIIFDPVNRVANSVSSCRNESTRRRCMSCRQKIDWPKSIMNSHRYLVLVQSTQASIHLKGNPWKQQNKNAPCWREDVSGACRNCFASCPASSAITCAKSCCNCHGSRRH